jgi:uncharacterized protein with PIN domain
LNTAPRFVADAMLGRLARWLRVLGYDTSHDTVLDDPELVRRANDEARVLLTRDRRLLRDLRPQQSLEIRHDDPLQQLQSVVQSLALQPPAELFTRCLLCNTVLDLLPAAEAGRLVPPEVRELAGSVRRCPTCGRLYWDGSHVRRMRNALDAALPGWGGT